VPVRRLRFVLLNINRGKGKQPYREGRVSDKIKTIVGDHWAAIQLFKTPPIPQFLELDTRLPCFYCPFG